MFEAYSVGIRVSLINGVSTGLMQMARQFAGANMAATALEARLASIKKTMLIGGALTGAGLGMFWLIGKTIPAAKEYAHQLALMNSAGMQNVEIARSQKAAYDALKFAPTSSVTENMAAIRELRMVFGNTNDAITNMPVIQRLQALLAVQHGDDMDKGRDDAYTIAKALELKGATRTPGGFNSQADAMAKAIVASGGKVGPQDFLSAFKYGRIATQQWSDQFAYKILPTLIQEMKGGGSGGVGGPGNALMTAYAAVVNGTISQKSLAEWDKLGLLDQSKIVRTKTGSTKGVLPGGVQGWQLFQQNPYLWAQQVLDPALTKHGLTSASDQRQAIGYLFQARTGGFMMNQLATQGWKFDRDTKLIEQAQGLSGYNQLVKNDPYLAEMALHKQWQSLMATLGYTIMPALLRVMNDLIPTLTAMTDWAHNHRALVKDIMGGLVVLATALTASGIVTMLVGVGKSFKLVYDVLKLAGTFSGLSKLASGIGTLARLGWAPLNTGITGMGTAMKGLMGLPFVAAGAEIAAFTAAIGGLVGLWMLGNKYLKDNPGTPGGKAGAAVSRFGPSGPIMGGAVGWMLNHLTQGGHAPAAAGANPAKPGSPLVHPAAYNGGATMQGVVLIDGKRAGDIILGGAARRANTNPASGSGFDGSAGLTPVGTLAVA